MSLLSARIWAQSILDVFKRDSALNARPTSAFDELYNQAQVRLSELLGEFAPYLALTEVSLEISSVAPEKITVAIRVSQHSFIVTEVSHPLIWNPATNSYLSDELRYVIMTAIQEMLVASGKVSVET
jgi:hypothetical protein